MDRGNLSWTTPAGLGQHLPSSQGVFAPWEDDTGTVAVWRVLVGATHSAAEEAAALPVSYRQRTWHYP